MNELWRNYGEKSNRISCYVGQLQNIDDDSILEVPFHKAVDTNSPLKLKPLNSSVEIVDCKPIIEILYKPATLNGKQVLLVKTITQKEKFFLKQIIQRFLCSFLGNFFSKLNLVHGDYDKYVSTYINIIYFFKCLPLLFLKYLDVYKLDVIKLLCRKKQHNSNKIFTNNNINKSLTYFFEKTNNVQTKSHQL